MLIALTGGIGAGKSSAASHLARLGAFHISADQLARDVLERGEEGYNQVVAEFGDDILTNGLIDRSKLGEVVFRDGAKKKTLEQITHPLIQKKFREIYSRLPEGAVVTYEIPLLAENPERAVEFDLILSIETSEEIRRERLLERGLSNEQASARIAAQAPDSHRRALAHHVIENNGDRDALLRSLEEWWAIFVAPKINR